MIIYILHNTGRISMTRLGINQFTLLKKAYPDKKLFVSDVSAIYNISDKMAHNQRKIAICEKLVNRGYLKKCSIDDRRPNLWWELTEKGKTTVEEGW